MWIDGIEINDVLIEKAHRCFDAEGLVALAKENGIEVTCEEALRWYGKVAETGDCRAMDNLGFMYKYGSGVKEDQKEAMRWYRMAAEAYRMAAEAGNSHAMIELGQKYEEGRGVEEDIQEAMRWYRMAAEAGNSRAMTKIGQMYEKGRGVERNFKEAAKWYRKVLKKYEDEVLKASYEDEDFYGIEPAAAGAIESLGKMYEEGICVKQDFKKAVKCYKILHEADEASSEIYQRLGKLYESGKGVKQDIKEAKIWYSKAELTKKIEEAWEKYLDEEEEVDYDKEYIEKVYKKSKDH